VHVSEALGVIDRCDNVESIALLATVEGCLHTAVGSTVHVNVIAINKADDLGYAVLKQDPIGDALALLGTGPPDDVG